MAEVLVSAVMTVLVDKLFSGALMNFARSQGIDSQLKKWKATLPMIQAVLADAAQKQITQKPVELWLLELQELAYDIEDVLDDMATEVMKRNLQECKASTRSSSKLLMIIPSCCTNFTPDNMMYRRKISYKLDEITTRLHDLVDQKNNLGLDVKVEVHRSNKTDVRSQQTSSVNESKVLGRQEDKEALIGQLLGNEASCSNNRNVISVVSIVGMGGLGKTTLAQLLYNDQRVKDRFELMAWVCVSHDFDVFSISKQINQAVGGENKEFANLDLLHVALKEKLSKKRFLVVLDDVWNEGPKKWDLLTSAFNVGAHGSKFLVTTRKKKVALAMDSLQPYMLEVLSDEIALSLFAQSALDEQNFDHNPSRKLIAQGIIKKCKGLPLALVTLGKVLKRKGSDDEWEQFLNSEIWNLEDESGILPALKLSYYDLPSHLKQLFAYCSLFPKDYEFKKKKLVLLWMAQGFLSKTKGKNQPIESLGGMYFEELLSRSFFQPLGNNESRYIMHDLMNDLATSVAGAFFFRLDEKMDLKDDNQTYGKFRHFSFVGQQRVAEYKNFKELHKARCLRTFLPMSVGWRRFNTLDNVTLKLLPQLHLLRVLSLTNWSITEVPQSIGNLKHLRYLNFSETSIRQIPEEVSELYNLQSLLVRGCDELSRLPVSFANLINLRHLDMTTTLSLKKLPLGIGGLTSLQTLSKVVIQDNNGFKISDLKGLKDLQGELSIEGLEKVMDPTEAKDANLEEKKGLDDLELVWGDATTSEDDVIEKLRPHSKLKTLSINGYGGMKFPSWLEDPSFDQLTELVLNECNNCTKLATLGHLTSLQKLEIYNCPNLVSINGEKEVVSVGSCMMRSLRQVILSDCDSLESYCYPNCVESLYIRNCSSMRSLKFSKLQENLPSSSSSSNLKFLCINSCNKLLSISQEHFPSLTSLEIMILVDCPSMDDSFPSYGLWPPKLKRLRIGELKKSMSEWGLQKYPPSLVELCLYGNNSGVVSFGIMDEEDHNNTTSSACFLLPLSLTSLRIVGFKEVESVSEVLQHLPHLQRLFVESCPKLRDVPETTSSLEVNVCE
uniref:putative disease resistance RPP13-like protein 1 n=1 Tax=Erigeron canadensis TaxID=72917 RepID=UPI001CB9243D|nr:putative disease resistance RPP13-like protein 1 [Erigeron canadensis]